LRKSHAVAKQNAEDANVRESFPKLIGPRTATYQWACFLPSEIDFLSKIFADGFKSVAFVETGFLHNLSKENSHNHIFWLWILRWRKCSALFLS